MKSKSNQAFVSQILAFTLSMFFVTGSIGLATVWLRHEISVAANRNKNLQTAITQFERRMDETGAQIAAASSADTLIRQNAQLHLGLVVPTETQVVRTSSIPEEHLAAKLRAEKFSASVHPLVSFRIAAR